MKRLLVSALLALLVHGYWLFGSLGSLGGRAGSSPERAPASVVLTLLATPRIPAPVSGVEPDGGAESGAPKPVPPPLPVAPEASSVETPSVDPVPVEQEVSKTAPESETAEALKPAPVVEAGTRPAARVEPKPETKMSKNWEAARKVLKPSASRRPQPTGETSRSPEQPANTTKVKSRTPTSNRIEEKKGPSKPVKAHWDRSRPGVAPLTDHIDAQPGFDTGNNSPVAPASQGQKAPLREARPLYKRNPRPSYPQAARRRGYQGTVLLRVLVNREGQVDEVRLEQSSGYGMLDRAALKTVRTWAFEPAVRGAEKVQMWVRVPVTFSLD